ncbi:protein spaetzle 4 isoform X2 [Odontomachus brunneus]|uniref:protein spaetzle 4 isoform X2 n=1 Tax=Odontomachus brunneus TaxID=486640 RepID=UPI0013F1B9B6|nr:protein spaetzle 4 isoform X2 [Odontomachus brunneus]
MRAIAPFVLQVIALQLTRCQSGGPSTFGYDASSACSKPYSRAGRALHDDLPCDFRRQNWCTTAGSSYPWHAVRRFVQENQGLMRRMYGDENYMNVLKAEIFKNNVEQKYDDYHLHFADMLRQFQYEDDDYQFMHDERQTLPRVSMDEYESRGFTSRSFNDPIAKRLNKFPKLSEYTRPHFKPTERTTTGFTVSSTTTASTSTSATTFGTRVSSSTTPATSTTATSTEEMFETQTLVTSISPNATTETVDEDLAAINSTTTTTTLSPSVTVAQIVREQNFSINEISGQNDRIDEDVKETAEVVVHSEDDVVVEDDTTLESIGTTNVSPELLLIEEEEQEEEKEEEVLGAATKTTVHETVAASSNQEQFRPRPEYRPGVAETSSMSGQLYQDVAAKNQPPKEPTVLKFRGVNACPVKEEVVAPFWANNTRGEVLALLNLYPFEQYVHWEKCTNENKQMYCRDGCRCEQQYRLHRLLAYDPNNECRGIFSDWFKFPSCCLCRCYDLPLEFRVTSRSPRTHSSHKRRIKVQAPRDRYA